MAFSPPPSRPWIAFARGGVVSLQGRAAESPLTTRKNSAMVSIGLAYRCCP